MQHKFRIKHITPAWSAPSNIKAITTLRNQNIASLNDNQYMDNTKAELADIIPKPVTWLRQTHSNNCIIAEDQSDLPHADAAISFNSKAACCVVTADCVPIILTDASATFVAAIHAGWRGIASGVIEQTLSKIKAKNIIAWIGPCICNNCYAVTNELEQLFTTKDLVFSSCFNQNINQKTTFDLKKACKLILRKHSTTQIYETAFCTVCDNDLFFSARKESIACGRIITCIWKDD
jgi:polyphenol oxidase